MHELIEALSLLTQAIGDGHTHIGEHQLAGVLRVQADLLQVPATGEAGGIGRGDQQRQPLVWVVGGAGRDDEQVAVLSVGDERLRSVDDIVVAVEHRRRADAGQVAARSGFGHRDTEDRLTADDAGQPPSLLFVRGHVREVGQHHVVLQ